MLLITSPVIGLWPYFFKYGTMFLINTLKMLEIDRNRRTLDQRPRPLWYTVDVQMVAMRG